MTTATCEHVVSHGPRIVACGLPADHVGPHYEPKLHVWWSHERPDTDPTF